MLTLKCVETHRIRIEEPISPKTDYEKVFSVDLQIHLGPYLDWRTRQVQHKMRFVSVPFPLVCTQGRLF